MAANLEVGQWSRSGYGDAAARDGDSVNECVLSVAMPVLDCLALHVNTYYK